MFTAVCCQLSKMSDVTGSNISVCNRLFPLRVDQFQYSEKSYLVSHAVSYKCTGVALVLSTSILRTTEKKKKKKAVFIALLASTFSITQLFRLLQLLQALRSLGNFTYYVV